MATFPFPDFGHDYTFVSLRHPDRYPITGGRIVFSQGLDITAREYDGHFTELQLPHSTALHSLLADGGTYLVGPMARYSLNSGRLSGPAADAARDAGLGLACTNPFRGIAEPADHRSRPPRLRHRPAGASA